MQITVMNVVYRDLDTAVWTWWWREFPAVSRSSLDAARSSVVGWDVEVPCRRTGYRSRFVQGPTHLVRHIEAYRFTKYLVIITKKLTEHIRTQTIFVHLVTINVL